MPNRPLEIVILAPTGQDGELIKKYLISEKIAAVVVPDMESFCRQDHLSAGAFMIADEALSVKAIALLNAELARQEPWSDLPIIILTSTGARKLAALKELESFITNGNVSLLERPLQPISLLSTAKVALRSRRRQFQVQDLLLSQIEATKIRDEFISIASHELKTPLTSLKLQTQMNQKMFLRNKEIAQDRILLQFSSTINQTDRLNKLVDDMLDVTRIDTGRLSLKKTTIDFSALVEEIIERFNPQFMASEIDVKKSITPGITGLLDSFKLEQVLNNLFSNAIRYAPGSPLEVKLDVEDKMIRLCVSDKGPGIPADSLERIFERFERANKSRGGLGLGLYITKQVIDLHGGSIKAESRPGEGSTFIVKLPLS